MIAPTSDTGTPGRQPPPRRASVWLRAGVALLVTALTSSIVVLTAPQADAVVDCTAGTGPHQARVEAHLELTVDGRNSPSDCLVIRAWQQDNDIVPASGYAGALSNLVVTRKTLALSRLSRCQALPRVVCVDLTSQMMWIAERGRVVWGPYAVRSGRNGYETRTTLNRGGDCRSKWSRGTEDYCTVFRRHRDYYNRSGDHMPYAMFFDFGEAFHTYRERYIYHALGSHGCVHMLPSKAAWLWTQIPNGSKVVIFGRKPGT